MKIIREIQSQTRKVSWYYFCPLQRMGIYLCLCYDRGSHHMGKLNYLLQHTSIYQESLKIKYHFNVSI